MKNVLMTLFLLSGLATTQLMAQTCVPSPLCPPVCCLVVCDAQGKAVKMDKRAMKKAAAMQCTPEQIAACKAAMGSTVSSEAADGEAIAVNVSLESKPVQSALPACCSTKANRRKAEKQTALAQQ